MNEGHYKNVPGREDLLSVTKMSVMVPTSWRYVRINEVPWGKCSGQGLAQNR